MAVDLNPKRLAKVIEEKYRSYLRSRFYFKDPNLRKSFEDALKSDSLMNGPFLEEQSPFKLGINPIELAQQVIDGDVDLLSPALLEGPLYLHQEKAIRALQTTNVVVATGTASGKTECFLYPILFDLYRQHLLNNLSQPGVRALVLYPMNALANDQRRRLGEIRRKLGDSGFKFTFGQYIGETPENEGDTRRNGQDRARERLPGELVFREEMRANPPHILLTNYSMLEYLLIRPKDSELFDNSVNLRFLVLDEAHQYRGARGIEMSMLIRRLKNRLRKGGAPDGKHFRCIATSATIASETGDDDKRLVAKFAQELFGEPFDSSGVIFEKRESSGTKEIKRHHVFLRALEGAFIIHPPEKHPDPEVKLNRASSENGPRPLELALCRECGQHYIVGKISENSIEEAVRDPSHPDFGVEFYMPINTDNTDNSSIKKICRICGKVSSSTPRCRHNNDIVVKRCETHSDHPDRLKECAACGYHGVDPVQEIVHGSDGPNSVIVTALHQNLPKEQRKILAFSDSRQEAAFFAWYAQSSYEDIRDRNLICRALRPRTNSGLSLNDLNQRLLNTFEDVGRFDEVNTNEEKIRTSQRTIYKEFFTDEQRISLEGVGLARWYLEIPKKFITPRTFFESPWNLTEGEAKELLSVLFNTLRADQIARLLDSDSSSLRWSDIGLRSQNPRYVGLGLPGKRPRNIKSWDGKQRKITKYLIKLLKEGNLNEIEKAEKAQDALREIWIAIEKHDDNTPEARKIFLSSPGGLRQMNLRLWRVESIHENGTMYQCEVCDRLQWCNIKGACLRHNCKGSVHEISTERVKQNHYRKLYDDVSLPTIMRSEEHTAQLSSETARKRQREFMNGEIHTLSSSTTFEMGVDLGDLDIVFMRNVPPETFNYSQRVGRAGRRNNTGFAVTYCRRNPHDLYHFDDPENRVLMGKIRPPILSLTNRKIIERHINAFALSQFFSKHLERFRDVQSLISDWENPSASKELKKFCKENRRILEESLEKITPSDVLLELESQDGSWIASVAGPNSRLKIAEDEIVDDYRNLTNLEQQYAKERKYSLAEKAKKRAKTIAEEDILSFLSRKAIIPKYGFPVDVVELEIDQEFERSNKIQLQRDLSLAIAEYAPGSKIVADKKEWESCGIKKVAGREWRIMNYARCEEHSFFKQWINSDSTPNPCCDKARYEKYLTPQFGFLAPWTKPKSPQGRSRRLYTTRPCFSGLSEENSQTKDVFGIQLTQSSPGTMVVLCEGKHGSLFHVCLDCGAGFAGRKSKHKSPYGKSCSGTLHRIALGHEFITDAVRIIFPGSPPAIDEDSNKYFSHSLSISLVIGAAEVLGVPANDLNAVITHSADHAISPIILYDNVPGGAGLVKKLEETEILREILKAATKRVEGGCGCGESESCYGCLRSYRNQYLHHGLKRGPVKKYLSRLILQATNSA